MLAQSSFTRTPLQPKLILTTRRSPTPRLQLPHNILPNAGDIGQFGLPMRRCGGSLARCERQEAVQGRHGPRLSDPQKASAFIHEHSLWLFSFSSSVASISRTPTPLLIVCSAANSPPFTANSPPFTANPPKFTANPPPLISNPPAARSCVVGRVPLNGVQTASKMHLPPHVTFAHTPLELGQMQPLTFLESSLTIATTVRVGETMVT